MHFQKTVNLAAHVTFILWVYISKGQWLTGMKTKPVNRNIITDQFPC